MLSWNQRKEQFQHWFLSILLWKLGRPLSYYTVVWNKPQIWNINKWPQRTMKFRCFDTQVPCLFPTSNTQIKTSAWHPPLPFPTFSSEIIFKRYFFNPAFSLFSVGELIQITSLLVIIYFPLMWACIQLIRFVLFISAWVGKDFIGICIEIPQWTACSLRLQRRRGYISKTETTLPYQICANNNDMK